MVPADDEHTSGNESEKNTSTHRPLREKLKFWKRCKQEDDEPARLTPMPPLPNEVVDPTAHSICPVCAEFNMRIGVGMAMALAVIQRDETLHDDHRRRIRILSMAAEEP